MIFRRPKDPGLQRSKRSEDATKGPAILTYLEYGISYKKDANHNREQLNDDESWQPVH